MESQLNEAAHFIEMIKSRKNTISFCKTKVSQAAVILKNFKHVLKTNNNKFIFDKYFFLIQNQTYFGLDIYHILKLNIKMAEYYSYINNFYSLFFLTLSQHTIKMSQTKIKNKIYYDLYSIYVLNYISTGDKYYMNKGFELIQSNILYLDNFKYLCSYLNAVANNNNKLAIELYDHIKSIFNTFTIKQQIKLLFNFITNLKTDNTEEENRNQYISQLLNTKSYYTYNKKIIKNLELLYKLKKHTFKYYEKTIDCPLLYDKTNLCIELNCTHCFISEIFIWFKNNKTCPNCRINYSDTTAIDYIIDFIEIGDGGGGTGAAFETPEGAFEGAFETPIGAFESPHYEIVNEDIPTIVNDLNTIINEAIIGLSNEDAIAFINELITSFQNEGATIFAGLGNEALLTDLFVHSANLILSNLETINS